jgi:hypothetical protein
MPKGAQISVVDPEVSAELEERIQKDLREVLVDVQAVAGHHNDLCKNRPQKWLTIASALCKGVPPTKIYEEVGGNYYSILKVKAQLSESPVANDLKRELSTHIIGNLQFNSEIAPRLNSVILQKLEKGEAEDVPLTELMKAKRELSVDNKLSNEVLARLRGDNVQRIEVTQKTESFEDMMKALREAQAQMPKPAEVVDVETIEEAD